VSDDSGSMLFLEESQCQANAACLCVVQSSGSVGQGGVGYDL